MMGSFLILRDSLDHLNYKWLKVVPQSVENGICDYV